MEKIHKFISKIALAIVILGFNCQLISMHEAKGAKRQTLMDLLEDVDFESSRGRGGDLRVLQEAKTWGERLSLSINKGVHDALSGAIKETAGKIFRVFPVSFDALTSSFTHLYHRFLTQLKPLDWDILIIINNRLTKQISPYTQVSLGNFSKEKRAEIDTNSGSSNSWIPVKHRILGEIDYTIRFFKRSLIWYSPSVAKASNSGIVRRMALKFSNSFSGCDQESIAIQVGYTISDLIQMREIIAGAKSLKEMQEKHAELKTWLSIVCQDLKYIAQVINYGSEGSSKQEIKFMEPSASSGSGSQKTSGLSLSDMDLSSFAGLN